MSAALAALAFVFAGLLGMAHEATTSHVLCATHGELVDSDGPATALSATALTASPTGDAAALAAAPGSARGHGDEHCLLVSALRASRIAPRAPAVIAATVTIAEFTTAAPAQVRTPGTSRYRIAPKTSPPV